MSYFTKSIPNYRLVETQRGDDLPAIAARAMGDSNRWPELVWLNQLTFPYLTDDEQSSGPAVILTGGLIRVPAPVGFTANSRDTDSAYERDLIVTNRLLSDDGSGDLKIVSGSANLRQQLLHRVITPTGQARRHPEYGCKVWRLVGTVNGPTAGLMGARYVKAALLADYRVSRVEAAKATILGDVINISAKAVAVDGGSVDLSSKD